MTPFGLRLPLLALALAFSIALVFAPGRASAADGASSYTDARPYPAGQCTAYVAERWLQDFNDPLLFWEGDYGRHARTFVERAKDAGRDVGTEPRIGAVAYEPRTRWGHVSIVEEIRDDGSFRVSESNFVRRRVTSSRVIPTGGAIAFIYPKPDRVMVAAGELPEVQQEFIPVADLEIPTEASALPDDCLLPADAISSTDTVEPFAPPHGRFWKVPAYLVPMFERACEDYDMPIRYLVATASYETHFNPTRMGDGGTSCGMFQFRDTRRRWTNWGFSGLKECHDPKANIRKAAEAWRKSLDKGRDIATTIRKHNGAGPRAERYKATVLFGAKTYYST